MILKKVIFSILGFLFVSTSVFTICFCVLNKGDDIPPESGVSAEFYGSGTSTSPYLIESISDLQTLQTMVNDKGANYSETYFKQTANIDLKSVNWVPIGTTTNPFYGNYDGNGFVLDYMTITCANDYLGLFGYIENSTIKNIGLTNVQINSSAYNYVGGVAGQSKNSTIENCYVSDVGEPYNYIKGKNHVGGIVGSIVYSVIENCYSDISISGEQGVGGIVGNISDEDGTAANDGKGVAYCYNIGAISATGGIIGGIVGNGVFARIENCFNMGSVSSEKGLNTGGIIGFSSQYILSSNYWGGKCSANYCIGSLKTTDGAEYRATFSSDMVESWNEKWTLISYLNDSYPVLINFLRTVTFDPNGGTISECIEGFDYWYLDEINGQFSAKSTVMYYDSLADLPSPQFDGHSFVGWYSDLNDTSTRLVEGNVFELDSATIYYAKWEMVEKIYTVTFNANEGSCSVLSKTVAYGSVYGELPTPVRTGYTFIRWQIVDDGSYAPVAADTTVTYEGDHTLKAMWSIIPYTVTLNPNGGTCETSSITVFYGDTYGTLPTPTRTGYSLNGWYTSPSSGDLVTSSTTVTTASDHTLYAHWWSNVYIVTFDAQGGTIDFDSLYVRYDTAYSSNESKDLPIPIREGFEFNGWYTEAEGQGDLITSSTIVSIAEDHTLYAYWVSNTFSLILDVCGGNIEEGIDWSGAGSSVVKVVTYSAKYGTLPTPTRKGHSFVGWYTEKDGGGSLVTASTTVSTASNHTLYAFWAVLGANVHIRFLVCEDIKVSNTYVYSENGESQTNYIDLTYDVSYTTRDEQVGSVVGRNRWLIIEDALSEYDFTISNLILPSGWVCNLIFYEEYDSVNYNQSREIISSGRYDSTTVLLEKGTWYIYICLRSEAHELKYDDQLQYFYFEDGEFPQTAVVTYDLNFNTFLTNVCDYTDSFESNGIIFYTQSYSYGSGISGESVAYENYSGQRFLGFEMPTTKTVKLQDTTNSILVYKEYEFFAGTTYWFRYDPIRWRVSDYGVEKTNIPDGWVSYGDKVENTYMVSDILWWDIANDIENNPLGARDYDYESTLVKKLASNELLGGDSMKLKYATFSNGIKDVTYIPAAKTNQKIENFEDFHFGWSEGFEARFIRISTNGSNENAGTHISMLKVEHVYGGVDTFIDAPNEVLDKRVISGVVPEVYKTTNQENYYYDCYNALVDGVYLSQIVIDYGEGMWQDVSAVYVRRYFADSRTYYGHKIEYSMDGETWYTFYDSYNRGTYGIHDPVNLYEETSNGMWFYGAKANFASINDINNFQQELYCFASQLVSVLSGKNQDQFVEYWTRDFGQQIGCGTYITKTGVVMKNSYSNYIKGVRFCVGVTEAYYLGIE